MKKYLLPLLLLLPALTALAADPYLLRDLPLGASMETAGKIVGEWTAAAAPADLRAFTVAGPVRQARDLRLIFKDDQLISLSFRTPAKSFTAVRRALRGVCGAWVPTADGHLAYEARRDGKRLQVLRQDDGGAWVVWIAEDRIPPELLQPKETK